MCDICEGRNEVWGEFKAGEQVSCIDPSLKILRVGCVVGVPFFVVAAEGKEMVPVAWCDERKREDGKYGGFVILPEKILTKTGVTDLTYLRQLREDN